MSVILTLTSCAIVAAVSLSSTALMAVAVAKEDENEQLTEKGLETKFADSEILIKALNGFDCHYTVVSENEIHVKTTAGSMIYKRETAGEGFRLYLDQISDVDALVADIRSFEVDYQRNVQAYTYDHIKKNLQKGMTIVEDELLDDDSIVLTINVE